jgi:hypothetical protein
MVVVEESALEVDWRLNVVACGSESGFGSSSLPASLLESFGKVRRMFDKAMDLVVKEVRAFIASTHQPNEQPVDHPDYVILGNIASADAPQSPLANHTVASVVNIAEEAAFKNAPHLQAREGKIRYRNAPAFLNLFLLFSANYDGYATALLRLSQVVTFFQGKNTFTLKNSPQPNDDEDSDLRITLELLALTFEQVNYLWASLGGKQMPFVLYKVRMVRIQADRTLAEGPVIEEIVGNTKHLRAR